MSQEPLRKEFHGFTWDLLLPSNIDTEIAESRDWERVVTQYIEDHIKAGMNVVDVGANFGWFTLIMAKCVTETGQVHAFEPEPSFFQRLVNHLSLNFSLGNICDNNVTLYDMALSDDLCARWIAKNPGPYHSSANVIENGNAESTLIRCVPFDAVWDESLPLHFIKIDVDGYELKVLKGATQSIRKHRPRMVIEIQNDADARDIVQLLESWNYNFKTEYLMHEFTANQIHEQYRAGESTINIIAEPK